jgi:hypothetical protein
MSWFGFGSIFTKPGGATAIRAENLTTKKPKATGNSANSGNSGNSGHVALNVAGENGVKAATVGQLPAAQLQATPHPSVPTATATQGGGRRKTKGKGKKGKGRKTGKSKGKKRSTRK